MPYKTSFAYLYPLKSDYMQHNIYHLFTSAMSRNQKLFIVLIDPDKLSADKDILHFTNLLNESKPDLVFIGGSLTKESTGKLIQHLKTNCQIPTVLFPGNVTQFTPEADALLFLSLISGRNPDFLIGQHVMVAPIVKQSGIETIPTGYILVESDTTTAVEYMSNTRPIPRNKPQLAVATAVAGELLGNKLIYLEAGSGAFPPVPASMICAVKQAVSIPLIVGGGLRTAEDITSALEGGADAIVVGNFLESCPEKMPLFAKTIHSFGK